MIRSILTMIVLAAFAHGQASDELAHILVQEWGVITWVQGDPVVSSTPDTPQLFPIGHDSVTAPYAVRAPVLYFNGPEFQGTVTVRTDNGSIFDIYPVVEDDNRSHSSVVWQCEFSNRRIQEYPDFHGMAPGEWNYGLWRVDPALTISGYNGWNDKFLYYETAPETMDFLPYRPGVESVCEEYRDIPVLVLKRRTDGVFISECTLENLVYGGDMEYVDITPDRVQRVLLDWSVDILEPEQVNALWNTWTGWLLYDHSGEEAYSDGMVLYLLPEELTGRISTISVTPFETAYPVDVQRYLLVALPL